MYNRAMKRRPSLKGRTRISSEANGADQYRSAALEPPRAPRRKQIARRDPDAADELRGPDWDESAADLVAPQSRR